MKIREYLHQNPAPAYDQSPLLPAGRIGIELELEGLEEYPTVAGWKREDDGSLRGGKEYVFDGPVGGRKAVERINRIGTMIQQHQPQSSFRCSTHIHMDVQDMDMVELERLVLVYMMMEGVMFDHCAIERRYSNFCTPFFINSWLSRRFTQFIREEREGERFQLMNHWPKYSALNLKPITQYGSVEFRGSHCMLSSEELLKLSQRMLHLKRVAMAHEVPAAEFVERIRNMALVDIFPTGLNEGYVVGDEALMDKGYVSAIGVVNNHRPQRDMGFGDPRGPRLTNINMNVILNQATLERYHLFPTPHMSLTQLLLLVKRLRTMNGVVPPLVRDFVQYDERRELWTTYVGGVPNLDQALASLNMSRRDIGL